MIDIYKYSYSNIRSWACAVLIFSILDKCGLVRPLTVLGAQPPYCIGLSLYEFCKLLCQIETHLFLHTPDHD